MYVPNPQKWVNYYESMAKGGHNPYIDHKGGKRQIGGSLVGSSRQFMVPIESSKSSNSHQTNPITIKLVSPSQQVVEQAKTELQMGKGGLKRTHSPKTTTSSKRRRTVRLSKKRKTKSTKKNKKTSKKYKKNKKSGLRKTKGKNPKRKGKKISKNKKRRLKTNFRDIFA